MKHADIHEIPCRLRLALSEKWVTAANSCSTWIDGSLHYGTGISISKPKLHICNSLYNLRYLRYSHSICLEVLRKITNIFSHCTRFPGWDLNLRHPEYEAANNTLQRFFSAGSFSLETW